MKQLDLRDMFKKASTSVCTTVVVSPIPCMLLQAVQLLGLYNTQKRHTNGIQFKYSSSGSVLLETLSVLTYTTF
jgi:hypothetical protein